MRYVWLRTSCTSIFTSTKIRLQVTENFNKSDNTFEFNKTALIRRLIEALGCPNSWKSWLNRISYEWVELKLCFLCSKHSDWQSHTAHKCLMLSFRVFLWCVFYRLEKEANAYAFYLDRIYLTTSQYVILNSK